ncbi:hypothetical protein A3759_13265 [Thalassolituus sp. HI0120]|jgi:hypothetical protein|nr:hypothetical protein A3759_13265 [Thalassolituus sp. HI0120]
MVLGLKIITTATSLLLAGISQTSFALKALDEEQLSEITGVGIGATFDNVSLHAADLGKPGELNIRLNLEEGSNPDYLNISELRLFKSGTVSGTASSGGRFGTYDDPFFLGDLRTITEKSGGLNAISHTALYTGFPAASLEQMERSFARYAKSRASYSDDPEYDYKGVPQGFFRFNADNDDPAMGNFFSLAQAYQAGLANFESTLDRATDKFDLHFRIDSINDSNRNLSSDDQLLASVDIEGMRLYGTEAYIWAHSAQDPTGVRPDYGLAISGVIGLRADSIGITADIGTTLSPAPAASRLSLEGVDAYIPLGSYDQPLTISTVQFRQQDRYNWTTNAAGERTFNGSNADNVATTQLRVEIRGLPEDVGQSPQGHIFIRQLNFGDPGDDEVLTGIEDIYLRDETGDIVDTIEDVRHYAFVPKTVTYNQEVKNYNETNGTNLPFIPNENVIEIRGLEIQRLVITTQDLNR